MIIQQFEKYYFNEDNAVNNFKKNLIEFRKTWSEFSEASLGFNIPSKKLIEFYLKLEPPLGRKFSFEFCLILFYFYERIWTISRKAKGGIGNHEDESNGVTVIF